MNIDKFFKLQYIYILSIIFCVYLTYIFKVDITFDTPTYINAWSSLSDGEIDKWRTPSYPLFLGIMKTIFADYYLYLVVFIQHLFFLASIRFFYNLMRCTIDNCRISFFLTFIYALYPCVATYNCCIGTSTFVVTCSIFLLYSIYNYYKTKKYRYCIYAFFGLFFLIFLRPAVVYLLPVTFVGWCLFAIKEKQFFSKYVVLGILGNVMISGLFILYTYSFKSNYGVFTPSGIGLINTYTIAKAANVIDLNPTGEELGFYQEAEACINKLGMKSFSDKLNKSISDNKVKYIKRLFRNVRKASEDNLFEPSYSFGVFGVVSNILGPKIKIIYYILFVYFVLVLRWMIKHKDIAFFSCLLFMIGVSNFVVIIIASPGEYGRLSLPAIPVYLIMFGQLLKIIYIKKDVSIKFE